jgi:hypothetical protein
MASKASTEEDEIILETQYSSEEEDLKYKLHNAIDAMNMDTAAKDAQRSKNVVNAAVKPTLLTNAPKVK